MPSEFVFVRLTAPVSWLRSSTEVFGTAASCGSLTKPLSSADWPKSTSGSSATYTAGKSEIRIYSQAHREPIFPVNIRLRFGQETRCRRFERGQCRAQVRACFFNRDGTCRSGEQRAQESIQRARGLEAIVRRFLPGRRARG